MRTRTIFISIMLVGIIFTVHAQITSTSTLFNSKVDEDGEPEYVTVGSVMPYKVDPFNWGSLASFMNPSIFKWWLNGDASGYTLLRNDGITPLSTLPPPNNTFYSDSIISIHWSKTGKYTIRVHEKSMPKSGITACDQPGDFQTLDVVVANRPSVWWDGSLTKGGCSLDSTTQNIPIMMVGSKLITIKYDMVYYPISGSPVASSNLSIFFPTTNHPDSISGNIPIIVPKGGFGRYELTITGINDKVSKTCGIISEAADYPADKYTLVVLPTLETSPIKFVTEL